MGSQELIKASALSSSPWMEKHCQGEDVGCLLKTFQTENKRNIYSARGVLKKKLKAGYSQAGKRNKSLGMECCERTRQYSLLYFLFACFIVVVPHCYDICSHFFSVKFILLCSVHRVEDSHLITVQIIDALLPEDCSHSTKDNLISTVWIDICCSIDCGRKTLHSECKYIHIAIAHSGCS